MAFTRSRPSWSAGAAASRLGRTTWIELLVVSSLALAGCAGGGTAPAAGADKAAAPARSERTIALVETTGPLPEVDRFLSRFLSELSDRGLGRVADARLSGAHLTDLAAGSSLSAFRQAWPSDAYIAVDAQACQTQPKSAVVRDTRDVTVGGQTITNATVERTVTTFETECLVSLRLLDARNGRLLAPFTVTGTSVMAEASEDSETFESRALEDAAQKAAKKLIGTMK